MKAVDKVAGMVAVAWAAIGLLAATLLVSLYYLGGRIDALAGRIDGLDDRLTSRIDSLDARLSTRLDGLATRMDAHSERHAG